MLSFDRYRLFSRSLPLALIFGTAHLLSAGILYQYALPTADLNQAAGTSRSNASVVGSTYGGGAIVGDDFIISSDSTDNVITSLTVYAISDSTDSSPTTLDTQFSSMSLYTGFSPDGGTTLNPLTLTSTLDSSALALAPVVYYTTGPDTDYQTLDTPATTFYSIYEVTFSGLDWYVPAGQLSYFGVGSVPIGGNTLALSISLDPGCNGPGDTTNCQYDPFLIYTGNPYAITYQDNGTDVAGFTGDPGGPAVVNVEIDGAATPEPSTLGLLGLGIAGLALKLRRRT